MVQSVTPEMPETNIPDLSALNELKGLSFNDAMSKIANSLVDFSFRLFIAILIFYIARFIIRKIYKTTLNVMTTRKMDPSLTTFVLSLIKMVLYFILIITIIGILGIETSSFLALFASAGVAIGMALSGTLQNFAGGVLILLLKPYKVGDYIEAQGYAGTVKSIQLFHTVINTPDNKAIVIPNGGLSTGSINNYSLESYRRVDWSIGLSYDTDLAAAKATILEMLLEDERVVKNYIEENEEILNDSSSEEKSAESSDHQPSEDIKVKKKWYSVFLPKVKEKRVALRESLREEVDMNAAIPQKVERKPFVGLSEMADSSINLTVRAWTKSANYWSLYFDMNARFYTELPKRGFSFPFPQLDVHFDNPGASNDAIQK